MFEVALLDDYQGVALRLADWSSLGPSVNVVAFEDHVDDSEALVERLQPFDCAMLMRERTRFPAEVIERLPRLRLLLTSAMWNVAIDLDAATRCGVQVCGTGDLGSSTPELTMGLILCLARHIHREAAAVREGRWQTVLGNELGGKTLGLLGFGNIGMRVAALGRAFGMTPITWSQNLTAAAARAGGARLVDKAELFEMTDYVSIHLKLSGRTRGLVTAADLALMRPTAYLVNTSRGPIVDEQALLQVLRDGRIAGAALDVFAVEPLPADHAFRRLDNVLVSPHVGYVTEENYRVFYGDALEDIHAFLGGEVLRPLNTLAADHGQR